MCVCARAHKSNVHVTHRPPVRSSFRLNMDCIRNVIEFNWIHECVVWLVCGSEMVEHMPLFFFFASFTFQLFRGLRVPR